MSLLTEYFRAPVISLSQQNDFSFPENKTILYKGLLVILTELQKSRYFAVKLINIVKSSSRPDLEKAT